MATIVILEHRISFGLPYMVYRLAERWQAAGHTVIVQRGVGTPPGDIAILHLDMTVVPEEYRALAARYPRVINGAVLDIGKSTFSEVTLTRDSDWSGPVIVKTEANFGAQPEALLSMLAKEQGFRPIPAPDTVLFDYPLYQSLGEVPEATWDTPGLMVEKFVPEHDERGYYLRIWTFFGERERSSRYRAETPIIKSDDIIDREEATVPEAIRAWREKLGFDYGKFDYVCAPDGTAILLDVNRTPAAPAKLTELQKMNASLDSLAKGLDAFLA